MASSRKYAYYLRGNQIALIEEGMGSGVCSLSGYSNQTTCEAAGGTWTENATSSSDGVYKSPVATVADGLEIEYAYSPRYFIETTNDVDQNITQYQSTDGKLSIADNSSAYINYATTYALAADKYIVLRKAGRFNGLHKIHSLSNNTGTNNKITLTTKYSGSEATWATFEETPELYYAVDVLNDESDTIDLPEYLAKALVYYVKAKMAEDQGDMDQMMYNDTQFRALMNRYENSRIWGSRRVAPGIGAIR
jgi:hypothetical protein